MYSTIANLQMKLDPISLAQLANDTESGVHSSAAALTLLASDPDTIAIVEAFITDAGYYMESILNGCLDLTVVANQTAIAQHVEWVALYNLHNRKNHVGNEANPYFEQFKNAISWAEKVAKRKYRVNRDPQRPSSIAYSSTSSRTMVLNDDDTENA